MKGSNETDVNILDLLTSIIEGQIHNHSMTYDHFQKPGLITDYDTEPKALNCEQTWFRQWSSLDGPCVSHTHTHSKFKQCNAVQLCT